MGNYVDLHIHTTCSDGTLTPEEIVAEAVRCGAGLIAVCDHNQVKGSLAAEAPALKAGLSFLSGAEVDAIFEGRDIHILCYGADLTDERLLKVIRHARACLDAMSDVLLERMLPVEPRLNAEEYAALEHDPRQGGWKLLQYFRKIGMTSSLKEGIRFYGEYDVPYDTAGFDEAVTVIDAIHGAGGCAVLAHPGVVFTEEELNGALERLTELGLDGVECYYSTHTDEVTERCLSFCRSRGLIITAGCDFHGGFGKNAIAQTKTTPAEVSLDRLVDKIRRA